MGDQIVANPFLHDYAPLGLTFRAGANGLVAPRHIGTVLRKNRATGKYFHASLLVTPNGNVFCGDGESADQPVRFVNTNVDAFEEFIKSHSDYTNDTIYSCQLDGSESFESHFLREIAALVAKFQLIDYDAIASRDNWWPYILDPTIAEYRRRTTWPTR